MSLTRLRSECGDPMALGSTTVAEGLLIAYEVLEPDRIRLLDVADVKKEHRWP